MRPTLYIRGATMVLSDVMRELRRKGRPVDAEQLDDGTYTLTYETSLKKVKLHFDKWFEILEETEESIVKRA